MLGSIYPAASRSGVSLGPKAVRLLRGTQWQIAGLSLHQEIVSACRKCGFEPIVKQGAPQIASVINLVAAELGVSIVPAFTAQIRAKGVAYRPIEGPAPVARLALAYRQDRLSAIVQNLLRLAPKS